MKQLLIDELASVDNRLLARWPVQAYIDSFFELHPFTGYRNVPGYAQAVCREFEETLGRELLETYHRLVLLELLETLPGRLDGLSVPASISQLTRDFAQNIRHDVEHPRRGYFLHENDRFAKDLGICRLKLLVGGPEVIESYSGLPRRDLILPPRLQLFARLTYVALRMGGLRPYFETHMDRRLIGEFGEAGYQRFYYRLAELLQVHPHVRGVMFGATWFVDPAISRISPELSYLRELPVQNGARLFPAPTTDVSIKDALRMSPVRQKHFDEGRYSPKNFTLVWPRKELLAWAREFLQVSPEVRIN